MKYNLQKMKTADLVLRDNGRCDIPRATYSRVERCYALKKIMNPSPKGPKNVNILTYRNNPQYIAMVILIFPSVCSSTDQIRMKLSPCNANLMCTRNQVLT